MKPNSANCPILRIPFRRIGYTEEYRLLETGQIVCRVFKGEVADGLEESMEVVTSQDAREIRLKDGRFDQWLNEIGWDAIDPLCQPGMPATREKATKESNETLYHPISRKKTRSVDLRIIIVSLLSQALVSLLARVFPNSICIGIMFTLFTFLAAFTPGTTFKRFTSIWKRFVWSILINLELWALILAFCFLFGYPIWR